MKTIGEGAELSCKFEWKIHNFFSYSGKDSLYRSPTFIALKSTWFMTIEPNGTTSDNSADYVSLYLHWISITLPLTVVFSLGIKTVNHVIENERKTTHTFQEGQGCECSLFIEKSELLRRKDELVPSDVLTVVCSVEIRNTEFHASHRKLGEDFENLFISEENSDVTLNVKGKAYSAHKAILGARSPVLAAMFKNEMSEKETGVVNISDCDPEAFNAFLLFLYSGKVDFAKCSACHLYKITDKYDVSELKSMCTDFMVRSLSLENFCEILILANEFDEDEILTAAQSFFNGNFEKIVSSEGWESLLAKNYRIANDLLKAMAPKVKIT